LNGAAGGASLPPPPPRAAAATQSKRAGREPAAKDSKVLFDTTPTGLLVAGGAVRQFRQLREQWILTLI